MQFVHASARRVEGRLWLYDTGRVAFLWLCDSPALAAGEGSGVAAAMAAAAAAGGMGGDGGVQEGGMVLVEYLRLDGDTSTG